MSFRGKITTILAVLMISLVLTGNLFAQTTYPDNPLRKLGRGAMNILFGWCEILVQPSLESEPYEIVIGFFKGFGYGIGRTLAGVYEVTTFPLPVPADYAPVTEPEFVFGERY